jgi:gluconokinase
MIVALMGVSGVGKTTLAQLLAARIGWNFEDADEYHPEGNRQKMAAGIPLTDADREPWLHALHERCCNTTKNARTLFWLAQR